MNAKVFFDTNVLLYAALGTGIEEPKRKRAVELIQSEDSGTSAQVLQEFYATVVRKAAARSRPLKFWNGLSSWRSSLVTPLTANWCRSP